MAFVVQSGSHADGKGLRIESFWVLYPRVIAKGQKNELAGARTLVSG
jgi:hypothetical protein